MPTSLWCCRFDVTLFEVGCLSIKEVYINVVGFINCIELWQSA